MENLKLYESFVEEINEAKIKKGLMHDLLNIPQDKKISDAYKNTKEDAEEEFDLIDQNQDGVIDKEEYVAAVEAGLLKEEE